jgi:hypothetical protein
MFFAKKIKCVACPGTLLGPQFVFMLSNWNTLYVVTSTEYVAYFAGSPAWCHRQTGRTMQALFGPTSWAMFSIRVFLNFPILWASWTGHPSSTRGSSRGFSQIWLDRGQRDFFIYFSSPPTYCWHVRTYGLNIWWIFNFLFSLKYGYFGAIRFLRILCTSLNPSFSFFFAKLRDFATKRY